MEDLRGSYNFHVAIGIPMYRLINLIKSLSLFITLLKGVGVGVDLFGCLICLIPAG
jgi:hypothetical protein